MLEFFFGMVTQAQTLTNPLEFSTSNDKHLKNFKQNRFILIVPQEHKEKQKTTPMFI